MIYLSLDELKHTWWESYKYSCPPAPLKFTFTESSRGDLLSQFTFLALLLFSYPGPWLLRGNAWKCVYSNLYIPHFSCPAEGFPSHASWCINIEIRRQGDLLLSPNGALNGRLRWPDLGKLSPFGKKKSEQILGRGLCTVRLNTCKQKGGVFAVMVNMITAEAVKEICKTNP